MIVISSIILWIEISVQSNFHISFKSSIYCILRSNTSAMYCCFSRLVILHVVSQKTWIVILAINFRLIKLYMHYFTATCAAVTQYKLVRVFVCQRLILTHSCHVYTIHLILKNILNLIIINTFLLYSVSSTHLCIYMFTLGPRGVRYACIKCDVSWQPVLRKLIFTIFVQIMLISILNFAIIINIKKIHKIIEFISAPYLILSADYKNKKNDD